MPKAETCCGLSPAGDAILSPGPDPRSGVAASMPIDDSFRLLVRLRNSPDLQLRADSRASVRTSIRRARQAAALV